MALTLYLSGGATNTNPELSLGGVKSSAVAYVSGTPSDLVGSFTPAEFASGTAVYRCVYVTTDSFVSALTLLIATETPSSATTIAIGWGSPIGVTEPTIADERTVPAGVVFYEPRSLTDGIDGGDFSAGQYRALWIRYTITPIDPILLERFGLSWGSNPATPSNTVLPTISGSPYEGELFTATIGTWTHNPTSYAYQWQESADGVTGWASIGGETTQTLSASQVGKSIRVRVTATNSLGSEAAYSLASSQITALTPTNTVAPVLTGNTEPGQVLTVTNGSWTNSPTSYAYAWSVSTNGSSWTSTSGSQATLTLLPSHVGNFVRASVTAINASGMSVPVNSNQVGPVVVPSTSGDYALDFSNAQNSMYYPFFFR